MDLTSLLKPDPGLGQYIFNALLALSVSAVLAAVFARASRKAERVPTACRSLHEVEDALSTVWDAYSEAMPGVLIVVGLVGTFVGLSVAITQAGEAIRTQPLVAVGFDAIGARPTSSLDKLLPVLAGMGVKFKSSIWGISFSLFTRATTYIISQRPRKKDALQLLNERKTELSQIAEYLWHKLENQKDALDIMKQRLADQQVTQGELLSVSRGTVECLEKMSKFQVSYAEGSTRVTSATQSILSGVNQTLSTISNDMILVRNYTYAIKNDVSDLLTEQKKAVNKLDHLDTTALALQQGATNIAGAATSMSKATENLQSSLESIKNESSQLAKEGREQLKEGQNALATSAKDLDRSIRESMTSFSLSVSTALEGMATNMDTITSSIQTSVKESSDRIAQGTQALDGSLKNLENGLKTSLDKVTDTVSNLNQYMNDLVAQIKNMRDSATIQKTTSKDMVDKVQEMASATATIGRLVAGAERIDVAKAVTQNGDVLRDIKGLLENRLKQDSDAARAQLTSISDCMQKAQDDAKTQFKHIDSGFGELAMRSQELEQLIKNLVALQQKHLETQLRETTLQEKQIAVLEQFRDVGDRLLTSLLPLSELLAKLETKTTSFVAAVRGLESQEAASVALAVEESPTEPAAPVTIRDTAG